MALTTLPGASSHESSRASRRTSRSVAGRERSPALAWPDIRAPPTAVASAPAPVAPDTFRNSRRDGTPCFGPDVDISVPVTSHGLALRHCQVVGLVVRSLGDQTRESERTDPCEKLRVIRSLRNDGQPHAAGDDDGGR